jgi:hypothetical protein
MKLYFKTLLIISCLFFFPTLTLASAGTISSTNRYAWSENIGWIDFGTTQGNVQITDTEITGYVYSPKIGWISLHCINDNSCATVSFRVSNDGQGNLSGYAYSENAGWIDFNPQETTGVSIDASGNFSGYAYGSKIGWIVFNCETTNSCAQVNYKVSSSYLYGSNTTPVVSSGGNATQSFNKPIKTPEPESSAEIQNLLVIIESLKKQIQELITQKLSTINLPGTSTPETLNLNWQFTKTLKINDTDLEVKKLQQFLNTHNFPVTLSGLGSLNNETTKFGSGTKNALKKFQSFNSLKSTGIFDQVTRNLVNAIIK